MSDKYKNIEETKKVLDKMISDRQVKKEENPALTDVIQQMYKDRQQRRYGSNKPEKQDT